MSGEQPAACSSGSLSQAPVDPPTLSRLTQRGQHVMQVLLVYEAVSVLVDHVEGLLKLLDLGLVEHRKDIGRGPLWPLLGGLGLGPLTGHLGFRWVGLPCRKTMWGESLGPRAREPCLPWTSCRCLGLAFSAFHRLGAPAAQRVPKAAPSASLSALPCLGTGTQRLTDFVPEKALEWRQAQSKLFLL